MHSLCWAIHGLSKSALFAQHTYQTFASFVWLLIKISGSQSRSFSIFTTFMYCSEAQERLLAHLIKNANCFYDMKWHVILQNVTCFNNLD